MVLNKLSVWLDEHKVAVLRIAQGCSIAGAVIIARSLRLFSTFRSAAEVPPAFLAPLHVPLRAIVRDLTLRDNHLILRLNHQPLLSPPAFITSFTSKSNKTKCNNDTELRVRLIGLQSLLSESELRSRLFELMESCNRERRVVIKGLKCSTFQWGPHEESSVNLLDGVVLLVKRFGKMDLGSALVSEGLVSVSAIDLDLKRKSHLYGAYYKRLLRCEDEASKRQKGAWKECSSTASSTKMSHRMKTKVSNLINSYRKKN